MMSSETRQRIKSAFLDRGLDKIISRKLLVWAFATVGVPFGFIDGEQWVQISMVYIGSQAAMDFILNYAKIKNGTST